MDNIGDYIYFVLIAVAALSGILKKKNKDKPRSEVGVPKTSVEDILKEFMNEPEPLVPEPAVTAIDDSVGRKKPIESIYNSSESAISYENTTNVQSLRAKKEITRQSTDFKKIKSDVTGKKQMVQEADNVSFTLEDARKAIIYSEIINRKY